MRSSILVDVCRQPRELVVAPARRSGSTRSPAAIARVVREDPADPRLHQAPEQPRRRRGRDSRIRRTASMTPAVDDAGIARVRSGRARPPAAWHSRAAPPATRTATSCRRRRPHGVGEQPAGRRSRSATLDRFRRPAAASLALASPTSSSHVACRCVVRAPIVGRSSPGVALVAPGVGQAQRDAAGSGCGRPFEHAARCRRRSVDSAATDSADQQAIAGRQPRDDRPAQAESQPAPVAAWGIST